MFWKIKNRFQISSHHPIARNHQQAPLSCNLSKELSNQITIQNISGQRFVVVGDTQSDSIQYLNFAKKWLIQYSIQYCFTQDSIQNIIQFKINSGDSIQNIIQFIINSGNSIQKIIRFNSQGMINTGWIGKVPKNWPKVSKIDEKGGFSSNMANIDSKYDSFIHFRVKFNSKEYSI